MSQILLFTQWQTISMILTSHDLEMIVGRLEIATSFADSLVQIERAIGWPSFTFF